MNTADEIAQWAQRMGNKGNIPKDFKCICNEKTNIIWQQIVKQIQPKQDIKHVKRILLFYHLNKLQTKTKNVTKDIRIKELDVWKRKKELEKELKAVNENIILKEQKVQRLHTMNNQLYIQTENIEKNIEEYMGKEHLLKRFENKLSEEIASVNEKYEGCVSVTPVDETDSDERSIVDDLNNVAEKLKSYISTRKSDAEVHASFSICVTPKSKKCSSLVVPNVQQWNEDAFEKEVAVLAESGPVSEVAELLKKYNRLRMWHGMRKIENDLLHKSQNLNHTNFTTEIKKNKGNNIKLYELQIRKALETIQYKNEAFSLQQKITKLENDIFMKGFSNKYIKEDSLNQLKIYMHNLKLMAGFDAALNTLRNEYKVLIAMCSSRGQSMKGKIKELESLMQSTMEDFTHKHNLLNHMQRKIIAHRDDWSFTVRKMKSFIEDFDWVKPLGADVSSDQVLAFRDFSLDYNKQFTYTNNAEEMYLRDCLPHTVPFMEDMTEETATKLALIYDMPFHYPEEILNDILEKKMRLQKWKSLKELPTLTTIDSTVQNEKDALKLDNAIDKIMLLIRNRKNVRNNLSMMKGQEIMDEWLNMSMGDFVLPSRCFEKQSFQYYLDLYNSYYKLL